MLAPEKFMACPPVPSQLNFGNGFSSASRKLNKRNYTALFFMSRACRVGRCSSRDRQVVFCYRSEIHRHKGKPRQPLILTGGRAHRDRYMLPIADNDTALAPFQRIVDHWSVSPWLDGNETSL